MNKIIRQAQNLQTPPPGIRLAGALWFALALLLLPVLGSALAGTVPATPFQLPPQAAGGIEASYNPALFYAALIVLLLGVTLSLPAWRQWQRQLPPARGGRFPAWGWWALGWTGLWWLLAWTRFEFMAPLQLYTFTPLWLGFVVSLNALAEWRHGRCLLRDAPRRMLLLFPLSAVFWWYFEYINGFVGNWIYLGVEHLSATAYIFHATLAFSTVLPAVASALWLITGGRSSGNALPSLQLGKASAIGLLVVGCAGLVAIGLWPAWSYPWVWLSPALLLLGTHALAQTPVVTALARGDWTPLLAPALAGLLCGFFWELWNVYSLAHWQYRVPQLHAWQLFAMPLPGYAGYLPFGMACVWALEWLWPGLLVTKQRW